MIKRVNRDQHQYFVSPDIDPVLEIDPGEEVVVETIEEICGDLESTPASKFFELLKLKLTNTLKLSPIGLRGVRGNAEGNQVQF